MSPFRLLLLVVPLVLGRNVQAASPAEQATRAFAAIAPGMVRVEMDLQFDKGEAPTGTGDHDPGSRHRPFHSLAEVIAEQRPLESSGFLIAPDEVVTADPSIHPRFIRAVRVVAGGGSTPATVIAYGRDQWTIRLKLEHPLPGTRPLVFAPGKAALIAEYFRMEGGMLTELLPLGFRINRPDGQAAYRVAEHQGLAVTRTGQPVGMIAARRLPLDDSWQGSPAKWNWLPAAELADRNAALLTHSRAVLPRVRLGFRSPKTPAGSQRDRMRYDRDENSEADQATERDVVGVVLPGNRVLVLANLKASATARLERITIFPPDGAPVTGTFVASLRDFGALVVEPAKPLAAVSVYDQDLAPWLGRLALRVDLALHGEARADYFHPTRLSGLRVGPRLESYPEIGDLAEVPRAFIFTPDRQILAWPVAARERPGQRSERFPRETPVELVSARVLQAAVAALPESADPANVPVSEAEENRLAWLGVELQPLTRELARANGVADQTHDGESGALVTFVHPGSPAAEAGLAAGTILLRVRSTAQPAPIEIQVEEDGFRSQPFPWERLDDIREQYFDRLPTPWAPVENAFTRALTDLGFGRKFTLEYVVDGQVQSREFPVVPSPTHYESAARYKSEALGITVRDLTFDVRRYIQRKPGEPGVVISKIEAGSKASVAGVKPYELITHVNEQPVMSAKDFERLISAGGELKLSIKRMAKGRIVTIKG